MKKYFLVLLPTLSLLANDISNEDLINKLIKEVQYLRDEVQSLKKNQEISIKQLEYKTSLNKEIEIATLKRELKSLKEKQVINSEQIEEVADYGESIEIATIKDKIEFGIGLKVSLDNFKKKYADGTKAKNSNIWSNKLMLNMKANIAENMNFYGRLSMYKYWGSSNIHQYSYYDNMQGRAPSDSGLYVERAYINWFFNKTGYFPMALTIGRQPSSDGPSNNIKESTSRKGTYSALLYDGAADGIVFTTNISKLINNPKSYLRIGYSKGFGNSEISGDTGNTFVGASNNDLEDTNVFGIFIDTTIPNMNDTLVQISYSKMIDIVANQLDTNSSQNKNIGNAEIIGAMIELKDIKNTNLDFFIHYGHSIAHPNSNNYINYGGLLSRAGDTSTKFGDSIWLGTSYSFGSKQKYKLGFEYNYGSKNWINLTQGSFDVYNKLATRGNAYELYAMYIINRFSNLRLGYINIDYDYTGSGWFVGESIKIEKGMVNENEIISNLQSIYLKMNVNF